MSTSSTTGASFTGSSSFASDLAEVVARAISFASLPMQQLENEESTVESQQSEVSTLQSDFQSLQTAIDSMNASAGSGAYSSSVDQTSVATATVSSGVGAGTYSIDVLSTGSLANTLSSNSLTTVTDPSSGNIDSSTSYTLTVGSGTYTISNSAGTLNGLASAINASGANVQATVVNVGSSSSPDYRLSVQGTKYDPDTISLTDSSSASLLTTLSPGSYVQYQVNGSGSTVNSNTRTVQPSTGLSVGILATGTANITVSQNVSGIENAINSFVSAYNTAFNEVNQQRGQNGGALTGDSSVYQLSSALSSLNGYTASSGNLTSLSDVGITIGDDGTLSFDSSTFNAASASDVLNFFGTESGTGFLQSASTILTGITDSTSGTLATLSGSLTTELTDLKTHVSNDQDQVNTLQTNLTNQMATADATISAMEQQLSYVTSLFSAEQANETASNG